MKRILTLVALSALIVSNVSTAGIKITSTTTTRTSNRPAFTQAMQRGYRSAVRGVKNHPYISGAAAVAAVCAASIASNNYAKTLKPSKKQKVFSALGVIGKGFDALNDGIACLLYVLTQK